MMHSSEAALPSVSGIPSGGKQKNRQGKSVRLNINARERRRMHDLNVSALSLFHLKHTFNFTILFRMP